jgi:predicted unusual protein kinase regulating ubiquinone biosynthesis (AarF/ABC1/UbiB family)
LIEELIDGKTIGYYEKHPHTLNRFIAMIGAKSFFSMLMQHNFVHADCHAGNILVRITEDKHPISTKVKNFVKNIRNYCIYWYITFGFNS